jgi:hypothetical protein
MCSTREERGEPCAKLLRGETDEGGDCGADAFDRLRARRDLFEVDLSRPVRPHREDGDSEGDNRPAPQVATSFALCHSVIVTGRRASTTGANLGASGPKSPEMLGPEG